MVRDIAVRDEILLSIVDDITITDISNPEHPRRTGGISAHRSHKIIVRDDLAYVITENRDEEVELCVFDISGRYPPYDPSYFPIHDRWQCFTAEGDFVFIYHPGQLDIFNFENRFEPELISSFEPMFWPEDMDAEGDYLYLGCDGNGIEVIDISEIENPELVGYYNTKGRVKDIEVRDNYIYVADCTNYGIYEFTPPNNIDRSTDFIPHPSSLILQEPYPNPFNSSTTIKYTVTLITDVSLQVFDVRGRLVETLVDGIVPVGQHGIVWDGSGFDAGIYMLRMKDEGGRMMGLRKVVLVR